MGNVRQTNPLSNDFRGEDRHDVEAPACELCGSKMQWEEDGFDHAFGYEDRSGFVCNDPDCESNQLLGAA